jgi:protein-disulfide isomerase
MDTFKKYAADLSLDKDKFNTCLDTGQFQSEIDADQKEGIAAGVTGTPAFFINGVLLSGAQPIQAFKQAIDAQLAKAGAK